MKRDKKGEKGGRFNKKSDFGGIIFLQRIRTCVGFAKSYIHTQRVAAERGRNPLYHVAGWKSRFGSLPL